MSSKDQKLTGTDCVETVHKDQPSVDHTRRRTLKAGALSVSGLSLAGIAGVAQAVPWGDHNYHSKVTDATKKNITETTDQISLKVRHSWSGNDLAVALTNKSNHEITITAITPARVTLPRGEFDFASLLTNGSLKLAPGESKEIPLQAHTSQPSTIGASYSLVSAAVSTGYGYFDRSVQQQLKSRIVIATAGTKQASVTVVPGPVVG